MACMEPRGVFQAGVTFESFGAIPPDPERMLSHFGTSGRVVELEAYTVSSGNQDAGLNEAQGVQPLDEKGRTLQCYKIRTRQRFV